MAAQDFNFLLATDSYKVSWSSLIPFLTLCFGRLPIQMKYFYFWEKLQIRFSIAQTLHDDNL